jgi:quinoprotein glucose dehydrogenase
VSDRAGSPPEFPSLIGIGEKHTDSEIDNVIRKGNGRMPGFADMKPEETKAITRYIAKGEEKELDLGAGKSSAATDQKYRFDGYNKFLDPDGFPAIKPPWGTLNAIDPNKGTIRLADPLSRASRTGEKDGNHRQRKLRRTHRNGGWRDLHRRNHARLEVPRVR